MRKTLGVALVALPFMGIAGIAFAAGGWPAVIIPFGAAAVVTACLFGGMRLLIPR
jgi:hypothetical protein